MLDFGWVALRTHSGDARSPIRKLHVESSAFLALKSLDIIQSVCVNRNSHVVRWRVDFCVREADLNPKLRYFVALTSALERLGVARLFDASGLRHVGELPTGLN